MRRLAVLLATSLAAAAPAHAAPVPDRVAVMSATSTSFAWDGQRATAAAPQHSTDGYDPNLCTKEPDYYCDVTHVKLEAAEDTTAELVFDIFDFSVPISDFDISIFKSDAAATPGEFIANGGNLSAAGLEETVVVPEAAPGYYLVTVSYYFAPDASYKGTIKASGITPPPAPAPAPAQPGPAAPAPAAASEARLEILSARRSGRGIAARVRSGAAVDELVLVLRDRRGKIVARRRFGRADAGTRTLKLIPRRRLRAGRYTLTASGGGLTARRAVRLR